jgi:hypothetical protein
MTAGTLPRLFDKYEASAVVRLHHRTLLQKAKNEEIGSIRIGKQVFFTEDFLAEYLAKGETRAKPTPTRNPRRRSK